MFLRLNPFGFSQYISDGFFSLTTTLPNFTKLVHLPNLCKIFVVSSSDSHSHIIVVDKKTNQSFYITSSIISMVFLLELVNSMMPRIIKRGLDLLTTTIGSIQYEWIGRAVFAPKKMNNAAFVSVNYKSLKMHIYLNGQGYVVKSLEGMIMPPINPTMIFDKDHRLAISWANNSFVVPETFQHGDYLDLVKNMTIVGNEIKVNYRESPTVRKLFTFIGGAKTPHKCETFDIDPDQHVLQFDNAQITYNASTMVLSTPVSTYSPAIYLGKISNPDCLVFGDGAFGQKLVVICIHTGGQVHFDGPVQVDITLNDLTTQFANPNANTILVDDRICAVSFIYDGDNSRLTYTPHNL